MLKIIPLNDLQLVNDQLFKFVWDFKHGDNIMYNFEILLQLYKARNNSFEKNLFNKPITIEIVSIVEAILIDFLTRIDKATIHLPSKIDHTTLDEMKIEIEKKKKPVKIEGNLGEHIYLRRKMYHYNEIITIFEKYEIFGNKKDAIYKHLKQFGVMRNRVHIENYHHNFEVREKKVFTLTRLELLEDILSELWDKMITDYKRPWK